MVASPNLPTAVTNEMLPGWGFARLTDLADPI